MLMRFFLLGALVMQCATAQILVQNAANPRIQGIIVPGSLIDVSVTPTDGRLPVLDPSVVSLRIDTEQAQIVSIKGATVEALVPPDIPLGQGTVVLKVALNITAPVVYVNVVASDFALFTNVSGIGQAMAQNVAFGAVGPNNLTHPAHPGDYVTLCGTGLGSAAQAKVAVLLGGHPAPVTFAGQTPALPGTDVINFQVPDDVAIPNGCFVAVQVVVNGMPANQASISKAAKGAGMCAPPIDLTAAQMTQLDAGQSIPFVRFTIDGLVSAAPPPLGTVPPIWGSTGNPLPDLVRNESFNVEAITTNEASLSLMTPALLADDVFYGCSPIDGGITTSILAAFGTIDLGPELTLTGPGTTGHILTSPAIPFYSLSLPTGPPVTFPEQLPPPYFMPGLWQIAGTGALPSPYFQAQYPTLPFTAQLNTPPTLQLTNYTTTQAMNLTKGSVVTWNPAGYGPGDVITAVVGPVGVACRAHASDGQMTIPSVGFTVLGLLGPGVLPQPAPYFQISMTPRPDQIMRANIPLVGGGTVPGLFSYSFTESFPLQAQPVIADISHF